MTKTLSFRLSIRNWLVILGVSLLAVFFLLPASSVSPFSAQSSTVSAQCTPTGPNDPNCICTSQGCTPAGKAASPGNTDLSNNPIVKDIQLVLNFLSVGVGIFVVGVIIVGGIQYSIAGESPEAVGKAKQRIMNGLIALVAFIFTYSFVQWLVPGGIF